MDIPTLFIVATCVTALLGLFLLVLWIQDRSVRALGWWASAYLIGGFAVALWMIEPAAGPYGVNEFASALLLVACGMIWSGARMFQGRKVLPFFAAGGAIVWLFINALPFVAQSGNARVALSSLIVASYAALTAIELKRDRRNPQRARLRAICLPILHGVIFLSPILSMHFFPETGFSKAWFGLFALLTLLYVVGTAFIVVVMAQERAVLVHKTAAITDPLTGLFNRRGFLEAAEKLIDAQRRNGQPITVMMFDLDHFKAINDRFGHDAGDKVLQVFGTTIAASLRGNDVIGRLGGEEFVAVLRGGLDSAMPVGERVRAAFQSAGAVISGRAMGATVSIGAASASASACEIAALLSRADRALYRAKAEGRNRVVTETPEDFALLMPSAAPAAVPRRRVADDCERTISQPSPAMAS